MSVLTEGRLFDADWSRVCTEEKMFDFRRVVNLGDLMAEVRRIR